MLLDIIKEEPVVQLAGELDASNADELARVIEPDARQGGLLALDLSGLTFLDASGVNLLARTADRLRGRGRLVICRPRGTVRRVLDVVQADRFEGVDVVSAAPEEVLRQLFTALTRCNPQALNEMLADDAVWRVPGNNEFSGEYRGKEEIVSLAAQMGEFTAEYIHEVFDFVHGNDHVAVLANLWGDREGKVLFGTKEVTVFRVQGGMVVEGWTYLFDPEEFDHFWS